jgi:hypothetical protein
LQILLDDSLDAALQKYTVNIYLPLNIAKKIKNKNGAETYETPFSFVRFAVSRQDFRTFLFLHD